MVTEDQLQQGKSVSYNLKPRATVASQTNSIVLDFLFKTGIYTNSSMQKSKDRRRRGQSTKTGGQFFTHTARRPAPVSKEHY